MYVDGVKIASPNTAPDWKNRLEAAPDKAAGNALFFRFLFPALC